MNRQDLVLDVCVLISASGKPDVSYGEESLWLLEQMEIRAGFELVLDKGGKIEAEYLRKLAGDAFGLMWFRTMLGTGKFRFISYPKWPRHKHVLLEEVRFHRADVMWVRAASVTCCKKLVTHDGGIHKNVKAKRVLKKKLGVTVHYPRCAAS